MNPYTLYDDVQLVTAIREEDNVGAFEELYKRYWFKLYSWAFTNTSSRQESEEMVQTVFERLWRNRHETKIKNPGAYLAVSLRNIVYDAHRKNMQFEKFRQSYLHSPGTNPTEEEINRKFLLQEVEDQLRYLPSKTRAIFRMNRYDNKSVREIAANLHLTEKAVEYHITRALKFLRKKLKGYLPLLF